MTLSHAKRGDVVEFRPLESGLAPPQTKMALFVLRASQQWVVLDPEGNFWVLPSVANPWDQREPFYPTDETELVPVPRHYKYMLGLPFN